MADAIATILAHCGDLRSSPAKGRGGKPNAWSKGGHISPGSGDCPMCHGTHPECGKCPNEAAVEDERFSETKAIQEQTPCWYRHLGGQTMCTGVGHVARHHVASLTPAALEEKQDGKQFQEQSRQAGGDHSAQRLDLSEGSRDHSDQREAAERLLAALL